MGLSVPVYSCAWRCKSHGVRVCDGVMAVDNQGLDVTQDSQYRQTGEYYQEGDYQEGDYQEGGYYQQEGDYQDGNYQEGGFYQTGNGSNDDSQDYEPYDAQDNQQVPRH